MKYKMVDDIVAVLDGQGIPYEKSTADNGVVTLAFDSHSIAKATEITRNILEFFEPDGSVVLKQKILVH